MLPRQRGAFCDLGENGDQKRQVGQKIKKSVPFAGRGAHTLKSQKNTSQTKRRRKVNFGKGRNGSMSRMAPRSTAASTGGSARRDSVIANPGAQRPSLSHPSKTKLLCSAHFSVLSGDPENGGPH